MDQFTQELDAYGIALEDLETSIGRLSDLSSQLDTGILTRSTAFESCAVLGHQSVFKAFNASFTANTKYNIAQESVLGKSKEILNKIWETILEMFQKFIAHMGQFFGGPRDIAQAFKQAETKQQELETKISEQPHLKSLVAGSMGTGHEQLDAIEHAVSDYEADVWTNGPWSKRSLAFAAYLHQADLKNHVAETVQWTTLKLDGLKNLIPELHGMDRREIDSRLKATMGSHSSEKSRDFFQHLSIDEEQLRNVEPQRPAKLFSFDLVAIGKQAQAMRMAGTKAAMYQQLQQTVEVLKHKKQDIEQLRRKMVPPSSNGGASQEVYRYQMSEMRELANNVHIAISSINRVMSYFSAIITMSRRANQYMEAVIGLVDDDHGAYAQKQAMSANAHGKW